MYKNESQDFSAIKLKLASPHKILEWSHGEVTKPETINYRTQKPEKDGLFCEAIFGPTKDWECFCGKYKRIRYKGIICDKCGVEVTRSVVRRERFGHIKLAAPIAHIWFLRGIPSKIGLALDMSVQNLEKVIYFANFIITHVDTDLRDQILDQLAKEFTQKKKALEAEQQQELQALTSERDKALATITAKAEKTSTEKSAATKVKHVAEATAQKLHELEEAVTEAKRELKGLARLEVLSEAEYHDMSVKYGRVFDVGIGAEAILALLLKLDLDKEIAKLEKELTDIPENKSRRVLRRLKLFKSFKTNSIRPEWMVLTVLPIIPPDLRPMVQLDGGRFATSDLNDLYRRIINRNNRLKRLLELRAPEVIQRNEKRMLQEAVDALIDNSAREGKTVAASTGQKRQLKSLADMLKGKQGRFRQNLLGKRIDYSGRSVIVVGPHLKLHQCGLPKKMALELFKPFVIAELIKRGLVYNVRSGMRFIETEVPEVWDILETITQKAHVLLNRAPTLHRLGIQAFQPVLIEGKAIQLHPLVCPPFNADFDGDQMAVHVPLTEEAKREAAEIILSSKNLLKPAIGEPAISPSQDIVLGLYYLTVMHDVAKPKMFADEDEAILAHANNIVGLQDKCIVRIKGDRLETTVGRVLFNQVLPKDHAWINDTLDKRVLSKLSGNFIDRYGMDLAADFLNTLKEISLKYLTQSGISWGYQDLAIPPEKKKIVHDTEQEITKIQTNYDMGLLSADEKHVKVVEAWTRAKDAVLDASKKQLKPSSPVYSMIESGARGSWSQLGQMMGMKGLVTNPSGRTIELPVKGSFKEGFDVLEYFISTHGARKGLSDTALRTASAGYLTRRLVDVAQDVVVRQIDCGDTVGRLITKTESEELGKTVADRVFGRVALADVKVPRRKHPLVAAGDFIDRATSQQIDKLGITEVSVRSVLTCRSLTGVCQKCYGLDLGYNKPVRLGTAVGIIAAQSIGEPGTQLTMRTFHTGGVAEADITQGLPRVEELFEARPVKKPAVVADVAGTVKVVERDGQRVILISFPGETEDIYDLKKYAKDVVGAWEMVCTDGGKVKAGGLLAKKKGFELHAKNGGSVTIKKQTVAVRYAQDITKEFPVLGNFSLWVKDGDTVELGQQLTEGSLDLQQLYEIKGPEEVQRYIVRDIQYIYASQGQKLNEKHIEVIIRQMFSRVIIDTIGNSEFLPGEVVERSRFAAETQRLKAAGKTPGTAKDLLYGISKVALTTESFLSAASFQETARVLIDAAITGKIDHLEGLKENVIIGRLIPAGTGFVDQPKE